MSSINNLSGLSAATGNFATIQRSVFTLNSSSGVRADFGAILDLNNSAINSNGTGVTATGTVRISDSTITFNGTGFTGSAISYGNNRIQGNGSIGSGVIAAGGVTNQLGLQ